jgi:hypothetical protein
MKPNDLTGQQFGRLTAIVRRGSDLHGNAMWLCKCRCGGSTTVRGYLLVAGKPRGCQACSRGRKGGRKNLLEDWQREIYPVWKAMVARCGNTKSKDWPGYGGRGITVCERWQDFFKFAEDMGKRQPGLTLERLDNDGGYEPSNCKWATPLEQGRNRRNNVFIEFNGNRLTVAEWARRTGLPATTIDQRVRRGWTSERTLLTPRRFLRAA